MCRPENDCLFKWCLRASWQGWLVLRLARSLGLLVGLGAFKAVRLFFCMLKKINHGRKSELPSSIYDNLMPLPPIGRRGFVFFLGCVGV